MVHISEKQGCRSLTQSQICVPSRSTGLYLLVDILNINSPVGLLKLLNLCTKNKGKHKTKIQYCFEDMRFKRW